MLITVPTSKSLTQRALFLAFWAGGTSSITEPLACADTLHLRAALQNIDTGRLIDCGAGGTTLRFLMAASALLARPLRLTGSKRLGERPLGPLLDALRQLGVRVTFASPPDRDWLLTLCGPARGASRPIELDCRQSSQFLSALLMVAPCLPAGLTIKPQGPVVSWPYVLMTVRLMELFGAKVTVCTPQLVRVKPGGYRPAAYQVPGDWSAAAFILSASRLSGRPVELTNCQQDGLQPDEAFGDFLVKLMAGETFFDLTACPDLLPALTICSLFAGHDVAFGGIAHTELKESPRASLLAAELAKVGADISFDGQTLQVKPASLRGGVILDSHDDHRLAMAFGLLTLRLADITISGRECVHKSYPDYWQVLERFL